MAPREVLQLVALTAENLSKANELFSSWCCRGNERRGCREAVRHPFQSRRARLHGVREQLDKQMGPVLTNTLPFAGSRCERVTVTVLHRPACLRELGNLSAHGSSNGLQHVNQASDGRVVGISKLARVVDVYAKRLQIQEKMTAQIANTINDVLKPQGVGVIIKATHHCMTTRGVHKPGTDLVTSRMLGCFRDSALTRQEFLGMAV